MSSESQRFYSISDDGSQQRGEGKGTARPLDVPSKGEGLRLRTASLDANQKAILAQFDSLVQREEELLEKEKQVLGSGSLKALRKMPEGALPLLRLTDAGSEGADESVTRVTWTERCTGKVLEFLLVSSYVLLMQLQFPLLAIV